MIPKEKAESLIDKYRTYASDATIEHRERTAINCAIIAVKEILSLGKQSYFLDYWKEVLTELNSMK